MAAQWGQQQQQQWAAAQQGQGWGQQQAAQQQQYGQQAQQAWGQQAQAQAGGNSKDVTLVVTGCTHATVGGIVRGSYQLAGENHGKPAYKKDGQVNGLDVMTYYWDERDGPGFCGWWFGPKVGGDQVWAYHTDKNAAMPPQTGWKVPYDGPVDPTFVISYKAKGAAGGQPQQQAAQQQQWGQQQWAQAQQQQQGGNQQQMQMMQQQKWQEQQRLEQQRQQLEALKQKQHTENAGRAQEMRQKQMWEQQAKLEENKKRLEEANKKRIEDQKKKMEDMKVQQQALIQKRAEEQKKKEEELATRQKEQQAVLSIRRVMQQFRASLPDKFDDNKKALDDIVAQELEKCGSQKERVTTEIEQAVTATKKRIDEFEQENVRRRELKAKAEELLKELETKVEKAEACAKGVAEEAEPFGEANKGKEMKLDAIEACASAVLEAGKECNDVVGVASEFVLKESAAIKNTPAVTGEAASTCAADLTKLVARINEVKKGTQQTLARTEASKKLRIKRCHAKEKYEKGLGGLKKYGKDGKLGRKEIQAFAKGEYKFSLPAEMLDSICDHLIEEGSKGVAAANFHRLKVMIGISREAGIDSKRKAEREKREKQVADLKEKLVAKIAKAAETVKENTESVSSAEKTVLTLAASKDKSASEMTTLADETDRIIESTKEGITKAKDAIASLNTEVEAELKGFLAAEIKKLENTWKPLDGRVTKSAAVAAKFRADAVKKNSAELEKLRAAGLAMIFHHQGVKQLMGEGMYELFDKKKEGKIKETNFVKFFKTCEKKEDTEGISEEDASRLFNYIDADDEGFIAKETFLNLVRKFLKVMKASVLTEEISIKSKPMRRLVEGEVLEALSGHTKEEGGEIERLKVKAMNDDLEGWVTPVGNQGTVFLEDGGNTFKVVKETILTGSFVIGENTKVKDRKLKVGEVVEVREWARKEEVSGLMRMKVRVQSDGQIGWATSVGNTGITFLECV